MSKSGGRARSDTIRIAPIRRNTVTPDDWGLHSVPSMLNDFQRHTSHTHHPPQSPTVQHGSEKWIQGIPAILALPTGLSAIKHVTVLPLETSLIVTGVVLVGTGPIAYLNHSRPQKMSTLRMACGLLCLSWSAATSIPTSLLTALAVSATGISLAGQKFPLKVYAVWFLVIAALFASESFWRLSDLVPLVGTVWWLSADSPTGVDPLMAIATGTLCLILAFLRGLPSARTFMIAAIGSGSLGAYLLSRRDIVPRAFNPIASALVAITVKMFLASPIEIGGFLAVLPSLLGLWDMSQANAGLGPSHTAWSVLDSILVHEDTRGIFFFFLINLSFMFVQLLYSLLSHSLGLLSDSIHMFFDCLALLVGLVASILSKFPPSSRFPYGLSLVETVSGLANGCLLLVISLGILVEAIERVSHPVEITKIGELVVVSTLGLLVNLIGIFAFGHAHSHDHSHSHGHSHGDNNENDSSHGHSYGHNHHHHHDDGDTQLQSGSHSHESDNLRGIFLHIMADTLGSVGVIISTILTWIFGWHGFDPLASILIALLIFASAIPLVSRSANTLLLSLNDTQEYELRRVLDDISTTSGVVSYTVPKFWDDGKGVRGMIHIQYKRGSDSQEVLKKVHEMLKKGGVLSPVIQLEEEGSNCWCQSS